MPLQRFHDILCSFAMFIRQMLERIDGINVYPLFLMPSSQISTFIIETGIDITTNIKEWRNVSCCIIIRQTKFYGPCAVSQIRLNFEFNNSRMYLPNDGLLYVPVLPEVDMSPSTGNWLSVWYMASRLREIRLSRRCSKIYHHITHWYQTSYGYFNIVTIGILYYSCDFLHGYAN